MSPTETKKMLFGIICVCLAICTMSALAGLWLNVQFDLGKIFGTAVVVAVAAMLFGLATTLLPPDIETKKPDGEKP